MPRPLWRQARLSAKLFQPYPIQSIIELNLGVLAVADIPVDTFDGSKARRERTSGTAGLGFRIRPLAAIKPSSDGRNYSVLKQTAARLSNRPRFIEEGR